MLIRSLEVESVGPIAGPIRLPLGTGLNVICGPNEIGKTTLARAAYTALTSPCWSNDVGVRRLMPRSGGHPRVCVEFDVGLFSCRLEKVFGGKRSLSRTDLLVEDPDGHSTRMSGDKAEERLAELLGMGPRPNRGKSRDWMGLWPLLWVQQGESSAEPSGALVGRGRNQLRNRLAALSGEVLAGVDQAPLLGAVQAEFLRYYSAGGRELSRAGSPLHEARLGHMRRVDAVEALEGKRREHEELIDTMNRSLDERLRLQDELPHLADEAAVAATNWEQAQLQEARCKEAAAHLAAEVAGWGEFGQSREGRLGLHERRESLRKTRVELGFRLATLSQELSKTAAARAEAEVAVEATESTAAELRRRLRALRAHRDLDRDSLRETEARKRLEELNRVLGRHELLGAEEESSGISEAEATRIESLREDRDRTQAIVEAAGGRLVVRALGAPLRIRQGKTETTLQPNAPWEGSIAEGGHLRIGEIAELEWTPGSSLTEARGRLQAAEEALGDALADMNLPDLKALRLRAAKSVERRHDIDRLAAESRILAPEGRDALAQQCAELTAGVEAARAVVAEHPGYEDLGEGEAGVDPIRLTEEALDAAVVRLEGDRGRRTALATDQASKETEAAQIEVQVRRVDEEAEATISALDAHQDRWGSDEELRRRGEAREEALEAARTAHEAAREAWEAAEPEALSRRSLRTKNAANAARDESRALEGRLGVLSGRLESQDLLGLHDRLGEAKREQHEAEDVLARTELRARAAEVLHRCLSEAQEKAVRRWIGPLEAEVGRLLTRVFPEATVRLEEDFGVATLSRPGQGGDRFDELSEGAREQLAILVRLAIARLMAEEQAIPILLDDSLLATDDGRFDRMADVLDELGRSLQIVVLTCHRSRVRKLGAPADQVHDLEDLIRAGSGALA